MRKYSSLVSLRDKFLILTNGKETEFNYFTLLKSKKSLYKVEIKFENSAPIDLVKSAKKYLDQYYKVWCVFDIDNNYIENQLVEALNQAKESDINIAYSNLSFEVYLIHHFKPMSKNCNLKELLNILNKYLKEKGLKDSYNKTDSNILKKYFIPHYKNAIENSKTVYEKRLKDTENKDNIKSIWEWNSSSTVFLLVEALKFEK